MNDHTASAGTSVRIAIGNLRQSIEAQIIGQQNLVEALLIALLADGHLLVEGAPGLAKTRAVRVLAEGIDASFHRIQFTPDLLPADLTGTEIYRPQDGSFRFQQGPLFHNLVLADEINRAPAKVQSALLEAMAERQITVGMQTYRLPELFLVMATQNPLEQEGTYPLPEAQLDRFLMHVRIGYPGAGAEQQILRLARVEAAAAIGAPPTKPTTRVAPEAVLQARRDVLEVFMSEKLETYVLQLVLASRDASRYSAQIARWLQYGASPRGTIALDRCARARAWLHGRDFVSPDDIQAVATDVLRHRLILSYEAEADGASSDRIISELLSLVPVP
jgi:MoxR-like ATPase